MLFNKKKIIIASTWVPVCFAIKTEDVLMSFTSPSHSFFVNWFTQLSAAVLLKNTPVFLNNQLDALFSLLKDNVDQAFQASTFQTCQDFSYVSFSYLVKPNLFCWLNCTFLHGGGVKNEKAEEEITYYNHTK